MKQTANILILTILCLFSCSKEHYPERGTLYFLGLKGSHTKGIQYLKPDTKVYLFVKDNCSGLYSYHSSLLYSDSGGNLISEQPVNVSSGNYNIYSFSENNTSPPGTLFTGERSDELKNGTDYLWTVAEAVPVTGPKLITLEFIHIASKVELVINAPEQLTNFQVNSVRFSLPDEKGVTMDMINGTITSSGSVQPPSEIGGDGNTRQFYTLPCHAQKRIEADISGILNNRTLNNATFSAEINTPFEPGFHYIITMELNALLHPEVTITAKEWISTNITINY